MKTTNEITQWGTRSVSFWLTLLLALGIIFVGVRFIVNPAAGALGFGIPFADKADYAYGRIKGIRDIFSGLVLLPLLFLRMRKAVAYVFTTAIAVPAVDFLIVLTTNGPGDVPHLMIHSLTAVTMIGISFLLFRHK